MVKQDKVVRATVEVQTHPIADTSSIHQVMPQNLVTKATSTETHTEAGLAEYSTGH